MTEENEVDFEELLDIIANDIIDHKTARFITTHLMMRYKIIRK